MQNITQHITQLIQKIDTMINETSPVDMVNDKIDYLKDDIKTTEENLKKGMNMTMSFILKNEQFLHQEFNEQGKSFIQSTTSPFLTEERKKLVSKITKLIDAYSEEKTSNSETSNNILFNIRKLLPGTSREDKFAAIVKIYNKINDISSIVSTIGNPQRENEVEAVFIQKNQIRRDKAKLLALQSSLYVVKSLVAVGLAVVGSLKAAGQITKYVATRLYRVFKSFLVLAKLSFVLGVWAIYNVAAIAVSVVRNTLNAVKTTITPRTVSQKLKQSLAEFDEKDIEIKHMLSEEISTIANELKTTLLGNKEDEKRNSIHRHSNAINNHSSSSSSSSSGKATSSDNDTETQESFYSQISTEVSNLLELCKSIVTTPSSIVSDIATSIREVNLFGNANNNKGSDNNSEIDIKITDGEHNITPTNSFGCGGDGSNV